MNLRARRREEPYEKRINIEPDEKKVVRRCHALYCQTIEEEDSINALANTYQTYPETIRAVIETTTEEERESIRQMLERINKS